jgi:hypothetical protein
MKKKEAEKLAKEAIENATPQGYDVAGSTVVYLEKKWQICGCRQWRRNQKS